MPRDRNQISFDQFVRPKRRWPLMVAGAGAVLAIAILATGSIAYLNRHAPEPLDLTAPAALSRAGGPVANETYQWSPVAIGGGGFISGLSMDPAGKTFVVRADVFGAYIWDAKANRWHQLATAATMPQVDRVQDGIATGAYEVAVAPSRPDRIYMAIAGKVYRTDNRGANWVLASAGNPFPLVWDANSSFRFYGPHLSVDPVNPDVVLLGTPANGAWRSSNAGASWSRVASLPANVDMSPDAGVQGPGTQIWFETVGKNVTGRVFAFVSGRGMYVSADRGASFVQLASKGDAPSTIRRGGFDRHGAFFAVDEKSKAIWVYRDGGWHNLSQEKGLREGVYAAVALDPHRDRVVVTEEGGKGYVSEDSGNTWASITFSAKVGDGDPPWLKVADVPYFSTGDMMFDPVNPDRLWVAHGVGVFYADLKPGETALSWVSQARGIEELVANDITQTPGHAPLFSAWDFGIHIKHDLSAYSTRFSPDRGFIAVQQVDWSPADPNFLVTNASDTRTGCCSEDGNSVMAGYSTDGGNSWTKFATLPVPPGTKQDDPWRMSFGTIAVASDNPDNIVWEPAFNRTPFYTTDRGKTWHPVELAGAVGDKPGSFLYNWYQRKTLAADKARPGTFYLVHSGDSPNEGLVGLWRTTDGGAHWDHVYPTEIAPDTKFASKLRSVPGHAGHLFFTSAFAHSGDTGLRRSTDGGEHWSVVPNVTRVDDVAFGKAAPGASYPAIYISGQVLGEYGIWRSIDNARSWQRLVDFPAGSLDMVTVLGADPAVFGRVYAGYKGSGFVWGEPAACKPGPIKAFAPTQCSKVGS
ncbi:PA14 domain-containing protein [Novosphingobium sp. Rr 2-17]|uniref:sialidase family protein n=1 Tax=Novosphingobium sp. Rr 2-17 TaxID=555793 RepID=UPI0002698204|nr:sialidase family protein [Novosphingobium sp. Rr 2-17]EIZ79028.1 PA14 domain-containing protein [Novosphingobium sp. Rr 2-17]